MRLDNFKWTRQKNGVLDFIDIHNEESVFGKGYVSMCMMHENKHILATNLRACFGFLTLHKSTKLAERILTKEKLARNKTYNISSLSIASALQLYRTAKTLTSMH